MFQGQVPLEPSSLLASFPPSCKLQGCIQRHGCSKLVPASRECRCTREQETTVTLWLPVVVLVESLLTLALVNKQKPKLLLR